MRSTLFLFLILSATLSATAGNFPTVPDSVDLVEAGDEISLFKGELNFGRSYVHLYFSGTGADYLRLQLENGDSFAKTADNGRLNIDYLAFPVWYLQYGERKFKAETELIQVDWPGNEINWRMIPRVHFTEVAQ